MPRKTKPRVKPAHTKPQGDEATLLRLRGDEMVRLHERVFRIESNLAKRAATQENVAAGMASAIRMRDVDVHATRGRVDALEDRVAALEAALFHVAALQIGVPLGDVHGPAEESQPPPAEDADPTPVDAPPVPTTDPVPG